MPTNKSSFICDRVSIIALSLTVFLGIIAFFPGGLIPSDILKGYIIVTGVLVSFICWLLGRLIEGSFNIPWTRVLLTTGILVVVLFLSSIFSNQSYLSFFGEGFEKGTFAVVGSSILGLFLASVFFSERDRISTFIQSFFVFYIVIALYQLVHLFFPAITSFGIFFNKVNTPVGVWSDFSILSGIALIGFVLTIQFIKPSKIVKIFTFIGAALALFFVILTNILTVWILIGISAIIVLVYSLILNRSSNERTFPFYAFGLVLVALLFVLANNLIGGVLAGSLKASYIDIHPNRDATMQVAGKMLKYDPILGPGPNHFAEKWLIERPVGVNTSVLWDTQFSSGSSYLGTVSVLTGGLGLLAVALFLLSFLYEGASKVFKTSKEDPENNFLVFGLFVMTFYFVLAVTLFDPGVSIILCAFIFMGMFLGVLIADGRIKMHTISFLKDQRIGFFSILSIVALLMVSAGTVYISAEHFAGLVYFQRSLVSDNSGDIDNANTYLSRAISFTDLPVFERARVMFAEQSVKKTLNMPTTSITPDQVKTILQTVISNGNTAARQAVALDPTNPINYLALGDFLKMLLPLKIEGAGAAATDAYNRGINLAPHYPRLYLNLASLYFDSGDNKNARTYAEKAIAEKSNYTDAYFLMSQIEMAEGKADAAITRLQSAELFDSNNPDVYFELGLLYYQTGDYNNAVSSFRASVSIDGQYLNAWYYLALSDKKIGATTEANSILESLHNSFPNNQSVSNALNNTVATDNTATTTEAKATTSAKVVTSTKTIKTSKAKAEKIKTLPLPTAATSTSSN